MGRLKEAAAAGEYPGVPGWKEPTTSRDAAVKIESRAALVRDLVMGTLREYPGLTADEIADHLGIDKLTVRPRVSELHTAQEIERVPDVTRKNTSGARAATWRIKTCSAGSNASLSDG